MNGAPRCDLCGLPLGDNIDYSVKYKGGGASAFCVCEDCDEQETESSGIVTVSELDLSEG